MYSITMILLLLVMNLFSSEERKVLEAFVPFYDWVVTKQYLNLGFIQEDLKDQFKMQSLADYDGFQHPGNRDGLFPALMLSFLKTVFQVSRHTEGPLFIIQIGGGSGFQAWPTLYTLKNGGCLYVWDPDFSQNEISEKFDDIIQKHFERCNDPLLQVMKIFGESCLLFQDPSLREKFDFVHGYNLMHCLNPNQHQRFLELLNYLLKKGGKAFVSGRTLNYSVDDAICKFVENRKDCIRPYFGFLSIVVQMTYELSNGAAKNLENKFISVKAPKSFDEPCGVTWSLVEGVMDDANDEVQKSIDSRPNKTVANCKEVINVMNKDILAYAVDQCNRERDTHLKIRNMNFVGPEGTRIVSYEKRLEIPIAFITAVICKE
jgi:hypothetical protein